jgi:3-hydroxybutyryl-CoA dehydrogenase
MIQRVAVIGAGTMGNGIAHVFAQNGFNVILIDVNTTQLDKAMATITQNMERQIAKGTITEVQKVQALSSIKTLPDIEQGEKSVQ